MWEQKWHKTLINLLLSVLKKDQFRFQVCKRIFIKTTLGIVIHLTTTWEDRRACLAYYRKMKKKRRHDCSVNLFGKISAKGRIHVGCSESQEYIFECWKKSFTYCKSSFQIRSRFSATFKQSYKLSERDWIKWLPVKNSTGLKNAGGSFKHSCKR